MSINNLFQSATVNAAAKAGEGFRATKSYLTSDEVKATKEELAHQGKVIADVSLTIAAVAVSAAGCGVVKAMGVAFGLGQKLHSKVKDVKAQIETKSLHGKVDATEAAGLTLSAEEIEALLNAINANESEKN